VRAREGAVRGAGTPVPTFLSRGMGTIYPMAALSKPAQTMTAFVRRRSPSFGSLGLHRGLSDRQCFSEPSFTFLIGLIASGARPRPVVLAKRSGASGKDLPDRGGPITATAVVTATTPKPSSTAGDDGSRRGAHDARSSST
jgi:hypothetical protein